MNTDGVQSGWLSPENLNGFGSQVNDWITSSTERFQAGDVVILHSQTLHFTNPNISGTYRISADTRWQPYDHEWDPKIKIK